jgi:hypothetical protein
MGSKLFPMTFRLMALFLLGAWLGSNLFLAWVATENFASVDRALKPATQRAKAALDKIGEEEARALLWYHSSHQNRSYFVNYGYAQLAAAVLLALVLLGAKGSRFALGLCGAMLVIQVIQQFAIVPPMLELGVKLDFAGPPEMTLEREAFRGYHRVYGFLEAGKLAAGAALAARLMIGASR